MIKIVYFLRHKTNGTISDSDCSHFKEFLFYKSLTIFLLGEHIMVPLKETRVRSEFEHREIMNSTRQVEFDAN